MTVKERLTEIWLWSVAIVMMIVIICTAMAWVIGLAIYIMRLFNG